MVEKYIKRGIFDDLKTHLFKKEITMIVGPRQCGKTTMMKMLIKELKYKNENVLFLNLDVGKDNRYLETQEKLISKIRLELGECRGFVFIDEVQRKKDAGLFLKGIFDMDLPYKFIVSGSGNIEIKEQISESLMGRKRLFKMRSVTFDEFVNFKTNYKYEDRLNQFFEIEQEKTEALLGEYINFGGYPKIITSNSIKEKQIEIDEIYQSYINQDIIRWLKVEKIEAFEKLVQISATQIGNLVDYSALAGAVNISAETVRNYIWYLRRTFVLGQCKPFFKNKKKEIVKSPIFYFYDLGLRNYIINKFGIIDEISCDTGFIFENFIFNELDEKIKYSNLKINFWRTKSQAEVDFIIDFGNNIIPIEAKFKKFDKCKIDKSMQSFIKKYNPKKAYIINRNFDSKTIFNNTEVLFIPFWKVKEIFKDS